MNRSVLFLFNLVQDLNILYKLIYLCKDDSHYNVVIIITNEFILRDKDQLLIKEINLIKKDLNIDTFFVNSNIEFFNLLNNLGRSILISASESSVNSDSHKETNEIFNFCPTNITKITIQHGFECVGFLQNNNHNFIHGTNIR